VRSELRGIRIIDGTGTPVLADVAIDADGIVTAIEPAERDSGLLLAPSAVDLHLDVLSERRRPRATVELDIASVLLALDVETAASGIGVVCIGARCEDEPAKGISIDDAPRLAAAVERLAPDLACDWRLHVRVEVTDPRSLESMERTLDASSRVALVSVMDHSSARSRFATEEEHVAFYAQDWGVHPDEVRRHLARARAGSDDAAERRHVAAGMAARREIALASHDDRTAAEVRKAHELGATVAEFPITREAAEEAVALGMRTVMGAPNVVRGRSTSPGNLLAVDAIVAGTCDALCSDYLPSALLGAPFVLGDSGACTLERGFALTATGPAEAIGLQRHAIGVGAPLEAALITHVNGLPRCIALWRDGVLRYSVPRRGTLTPLAMRAA